MAEIVVNTVLDCGDDVVHLRDALSVLDKNNPNYSKILLAISLQDSKRLGKALMNIYREYYYPQEELKKRNEINRLNQI